MSANFSLDELTRSDTAARLGIDNTPGPAEFRAINSYLMPGLETIRSILGGRSVHISSGFRSKELNTKIPGSSDTSAHTLGYAADFTCPGFGSPFEICQKLQTDLTVFDQIIYEYGRWVHVSFDPRNRKQVLTKLYGQPYRVGLFKV